jgi:hypothetical protein
MVFQASANIVTGDRPIIEGTSSISDHHIRARLDRK